MKQIVRYIWEKYKIIFKYYIKNYYKTNHKRNVLISYITHPFYKNKIDYSHTNMKEALVIAEVFKELNFNVDIINFNSRKQIDYKKYEIIFGFGDPFEASFYTKNTAKKIYYATGAHPCFQNQAEIKRLKYLRERSGRLLRPRRILNSSLPSSPILADNILSLGNQFTIESYKPYFEGDIYNIPASTYLFFSLDHFNRDWEKARYHFLWFGSSGLVHKGLDLCLDVFKKNSMYNLHICGPIEEDFFELYNKELNELENVHYHGFVDVSSQEFKHITEQCAFSIFPSCSEGGGVSLLTSMGTGLIPLATYESSVNIFDFGIKIEEARVETIEKVVNYAANLDLKELEKRSRKSYSYILNYHSIENYRRVLKNVIYKII